MRIREQVRPSRQPADADADAKALLFFKSSPGQRHAVARRLAKLALDGGKRVGFCAAKGRAPLGVICLEHSERAEILLGFWAASVIAFSLIRHLICIKFGKLDISAPEMPDRPARQSLNRRGIVLIGMIRLSLMWLNY